MRFKNLLTGAKSMLKTSMSKILSSRVQRMNMIAKIKTKKIKTTRKLNKVTGMHMYGID